MAQRRGSLTPGILGMAVAGACVLACAAARAEGPPPLVSDPQSNALVREYLTAAHAVAGYNRSRCGALAPLPTVDDQGVYQTAIRAFLPAADQDRVDAFLTSAAITEAKLAGQKRMDEMLASVPEANLPKFCNNLHDEFSRRYADAENKWRAFIKS